MLSPIRRLALATLELTSENQAAVAEPPWWPEAMPPVEVTAAVIVGTLVLAAVVAVVIVRVVVPSGVRVVRAVRRTWARVTPKTTAGKVLSIFTLLFLVAAAPTLVTLVDAKGAIGNVAGGTGTIAEMDGDAIEFVDAAGLARPSPDRDGDRLLDGWEEAGRTPDGVPLPGADPDRKDLYLQVLYGDGIATLTESERARLRTIWARMPVSNPDGSTGIALHLVDERRLDQEVRTYEPDEELIRSRYDDAHLDGATCVYYQTTFADLTHPKLGGRGALGGYVSIVDGTDTAGGEGRSNRVAFLTHELLHNTAGHVEGRTHTTSGWLSPRYDGTDADARLSAATAADLDDGFELGGYEERHLCGS
ncbi:hypothetical protein C2R22_14045 [Salinigranum rubrum]|uniref:Uncharacterized protein n=1 Tax=Salinigranum rubrum TaxID=755307 RepID=A0A2I8VL30_9EURY|nr:hypothetical protein C2R22_14045 [Salinigranum rubrum]